MGIRQYADPHQERNLQDRDEENCTNQTPTGVFMSALRFRVAVQSTVHIVHGHTRIHAALALPLPATRDTACQQDCSAGISTPRSIAPLLPSLLTYQGQGDQNVHVDGGSVGCIGTLHRRRRCRVHLRRRRWTFWLAVWQAPRMVSRRPPPVSHLTFDKFTRARTQALSLSPTSSSTAVSFTAITHDSALSVYSFTAGVCENVHQRHKGQSFLG